MSKRAKGQRATTTPTPAAEPPLTAPGPDVLRRTLLVVLTGLVVARPVVRAEDPGLLSPLSDPGGMVLTMLALLALTGWAAWRLWARQRAVYAGWVELGLAVVAALYFVAVWRASYQRPAWLAAWEWAGVVLL